MIRHNLIKPMDGSMPERSKFLSNWKNISVYFLSWTKRYNRVIESDLKAPFSISTTPRCRGGRYSFVWIVPLYPWSVPYNAELSKEASSTIFWVFGMTWPGIEPRSPGPLANTLSCQCLVTRYKKNAKSFQQLGFKIFQFLCNP